MTYSPSGLPRGASHQIDSTNVIERFNGEIKRRSDAVGIFPNEAAIVRLVGALLLEQDDQYTIQKRYMSLESRTPMSDNPSLNLPAISPAS